jgi:hypothetical protein
MIYVLIAIVGLIGGAVCVYAILNPRLARVEAQRQSNERRVKQIETDRAALNTQNEQVEELAKKLKTKEAENGAQTANLRLAQDQFNARVISYKELQDENALLKRDLQNIDVNLRKLEMDRETQGLTQETLDQRSQELGSRYLKENVKWISNSLTANNFASCKQRLLDVIERVRTIGFPVNDAEKSQLLTNLRSEYEMAVRAAFEREEQARIRSQIREEQKLQNEIDREIKRLDRERAVIQAALDKALADANGQLTAEVESLKNRLADAEAKAQRAISQAQLTKAGHVYVISNIGSFGEGIFKIGLTRRLEPKERVYELGSASVPFPFDIHMMISSDDAPALEYALHRALSKQRINKANPRKEYFRTDIETISNIVRQNHGEIQYVADAEALEYRQSQSMPDEDIQFIQNIYDRLDEEEEIEADD